MNARKAQAIWKMIKDNTAVKTGERKSVARRLRRAYNRNRVPKEVLAGIQWFQRGLSIESRLRAEGIINEYKTQND